MSEFDLLVSDLAKQAKRPAAPKLDAMMKSLSGLVTATESKLHRERGSLHQDPRAMLRKAFDQACVEGRISPVERIAAEIDLCTQGNTISREFLAKALGNDSSGDADEGGDDLQASFGSDVSAPDIRSRMSAQIGAAFKAGLINASDVAHGEALLNRGQPLPSRLVQKMQAGAKAG